MVAAHEADGSTTARWLLGVGATAGLVVAMAGIVEKAPQRGDLPDDAAAVVNGSVIRRSHYERALAALASDSRNPLGEKERAHILDRLIEEELLVQRAVELGLDRSDPVVRNTLVSAMIETIVLGVGQEEPSDEDVAAFYETNREFFARSDRFWVRQLRLPITKNGVRDEAGALARAQEASRRIRNGETLAVVGQDLGAGGVVPLPDGHLPAAKLREYLGPTPTLAATQMQTGDVSEPVRGGSAWHVLQMVERITSPPRSLEAVASQVRAEMRRRAGDDSLRAYLDQLRADAEVRLPTS